MLKNKINDLINKEVVENGWPQTLTIKIELNQKEKQEFINDLADDFPYFWELENDIIYITYNE